MYKITISLSYIKLAEADSPKSGSSQENDCFGLMKVPDKIWNGTMKPTEK